MKTIKYGDGTRYGDPNTRWGNPSYRLEPGDPGYVPPISPPNRPKSKRSRMKRNTYYPVRIADQITFLVNWCNKLPGYATTLGLSPAQSTASVADGVWLVYVLQSWLTAVRAFSLAGTEAANTAQTGDGTALMVLPVFAPAAPPAGVVPVNTGALNRIFALVQIIKDSNAYTDTIGLDLGIVGSTQTPPDYATLAPEFKVSRTAGGVNVGWGWGRNSAFLDMIELQVDRGDSKGFVPLAFDTTPGYLDTCAQPTTPVKWKYRGIYRVGDEQVGQWSNEMSITVGG